jgi:phosphatidate cytidylyltransferase
MIETYFSHISDEIIWIFTGLLSFLILCSFSFFVLNKLKPSKLSKELILRTTTWWKIALIVFLLATLPEFGAVLIVAYVSFLALRELISVLELKYVSRKAIAICYLAIPLYYGLLCMKYSAIVYLGFAILLYIFIALFSIKSGQVNGVKWPTLILFSSCILTIFLPSYLIQILQLKCKYLSINASHLLLFFIFIVAFNDVFQFTWGTIFGRTKLFPRISPNKTLEGLLLGVLTTLVLGAILRFLTPFSIPTVLVISGAVGIAGFIGDIFLSAIKRHLKIKDFSQTLPGHGGVLDRMDSLLISVPIYYYLVLNFLHFYS